MTPEPEQPFAGALSAEVACSALSDSQMRILRWAERAANGQIIVAGHGQIHRVSAARALCRKGLMLEWRTSHYAITDDGRAFLAPNSSISNESP